MVDVANFARSNVAVCLPIGDKAIFRAVSADMRCICWIGFRRELGLGEGNADTLYMYIPSYRPKEWKNRGKVKINFWFRLKCELRLAKSSVVHRFCFSFPEYRHKNSEPPMHLPLHLPIQFLFLVCVASFLPCLRCFLSLACTASSLPHLRNFLARDATSFLGEVLLFVLARIRAWRARVYYSIFVFLLSHLSQQRC